MGNAKYVLNNTVCEYVYRYNEVLSIYCTAIEEFYDDNIILLGWYERVAAKSL